MFNGIANKTQEDGSSPYNYLALLFGILLIVAIMLGNILVCLSVLLERSLKTATNYFIVSLAVADLLLAVLVLPLYVYTEFQGGIWTLNMLLCDALMTMDVMLCTASILNLCAISVDRYIAVMVPLKYNRNQFSARQLILIVATWLLSFGVASPVIFGLNNVPQRDVTTCKLEDGTFVVYSSICSFFIPCPAMLLLYYGMFRGLRRWGKKPEVRQRDRDRDRDRTLSFRLTVTEAKADAGTQLAADTGTSPGLQGVLVMPPLDSTSDMEFPEAANPRENGCAASTGAGPRSRSVSRRERKAMKVLPIVGCSWLAGLPSSWSTC
ncbi:dopamine receptor D4 related sequence isoform X2 [Rhinoraja longicauda]